VRQAGKKGPSELTVVSTLLGQERRAWRDARLAELAQHKIREEKRVGGVVTLTRL
jgi:hypothetical protein